MVITPQEIYVAATVFTVIAAIAGGTFIPWGKIPVPMWVVRTILWFRRAKVNDLCPACGHRKGSIKHVTDGARVAIEHTCKVCGWVWQSGTVLTIEAEDIIVGKTPAADQQTALAEAAVAAQADKNNRAPRAIDYKVN